MDEMHDTKCGRSLMSYCRVTPLHFMCGVIRMSLKWKIGKTQRSKVVTYLAVRCVAIMDVFTNNVMTMNILCGMMVLTVLPLSFLTLTWLKCLCKVVSYELYPFV